MGCAAQKSSQSFVSKADLIELQTYPEELHEKRIKILQWMENDGGLKSKINLKKVQQNDQLLYWQEAWQREQELVAHPSMVDSCQSKIPCITTMDENLRILSDEMNAFRDELETTN